MSGEALYERYKDALRRGHVASLQGRLSDALEAYAEAASIAPERATPHTSAGNALMRRRRLDDALDQFAIALRLAPGDEAALGGRAEALAALDRSHEAADAFDALADARATAGRLADAVDAARRGLELAEGRERRRHLRALVERLRDAETGVPGQQALQRALQVLDGPAIGSPTAASASAMPAAGREQRPGDVPASALDARGMDAADATTRAVEPAPEDAAPEAAVEPAGEDAAPEAAVKPAPEDAAPEAAVEPAAPPVLQRDLPPDADVAALARAAEEAIDADDPTAAVERLLDLAAAYRQEGAREAALDACYLGLSLVPDHTLLQLALAELYDDRGWRSLAADKLALLDRVVALDDDAEAAGLVAAARARRG
jgi:tetratricopeptide (TPR) repeat protein